LAVRATSGRSAQALCNVDHERRRKRAFMKLDLGGTLRARDSASTLAWVRPLLPAFGITRIANITGLDRIGIPVWICIRPNGRALSVSQGKGITADLAQASAVMESIELYHAERAAAPDLVASYRTARRQRRLINPRDLPPGVRGRTYDGRREIAWAAGTDLVSGERVLVPHARVDLNLSRPHPDAGLFLATSTGLASGNERSEALCHALFEVVERDCEWRWDRLSPAARLARELNCDSVESPMLRDLIDRIEHAGVSVRLWDITSTAGIPAFRCTILDRGPLACFGYFEGSGCHLSAEVALSRAITEAVQSRLTLISGSRDDVFPSFYDSRPVPALPDRRSPPSLVFRPRASCTPGTTFADDVETTLALLVRAGFRDVVAVEHTRPEFGIPVVAVVIPGMREVP
jgi:ribosomal protein S12 methylthiotransferase accessory factor